LLARGVDGLLRETRVAIDVLGFLSGCGRDHCRSSDKGTPVGRELFAGSVRDSVAEPGFLHIHG
jgi:hypothetical protein